MFRGMMKNWPIRYGIYYNVGSRTESGSSLSLTTEHRLVSPTFTHLATLSLETACRVTFKTYVPIWRKFPMALSL